MLFSVAFQKTQKAQAAHQDIATWTWLPPRYCNFWEWGGSLLGNDVHTKAQTRQKSQLQSPGGSRLGISASSRHRSYLAVRKLAEGTLHFAVLPLHIFGFLVWLSLTIQLAKIAFCESWKVFVNSIFFWWFLATSKFGMLIRSNRTDTPELKSLIRSFRAYWLMIHVYEENF